MQQENNPEKNFFRRLVAMYGEWRAENIFKEKVGKEVPILLEIKEDLPFDLNNM